MPSRLKLGWRWRCVFKAAGDLTAGGLDEALPFVVEVAAGAGLSMEKLSLAGRAKGLTELAAVMVEAVVLERGESPVDDGDMLCAGLVGDVAEVVSRPASSDLLELVQGLSDGLGAGPLHFIGVQEYL